MEYTLAKQEMCTVIYLEICHRGYQM